MTALNTNLALRSSALTGTGAIPALPRLAVPVSRGSPAGCYPGGPDKPSTWQVTLQDVDMLVTAGRGRPS